jgi:acetoacetyl-CoA synthetase
LGAPLERVAAATVTAFRRAASERAGRDLDDYAVLWQWSVDDPPGFWRLLWDFCGVIGDPGQVVLADDERMPGARWFPQARLNYAGNLLRRRDDAEALVFWGEDRVWRRLSRTVWPGPPRSPAGWSR